MSDWARVPGQADFHNPHPYRPGRRYRGCGIQHKPHTGPVPYPLEARQPGRLYRLRSIHPLTCGGPVRGDFLFPLPGRCRHLFPGRHKDTLYQRLGPGRRSAACEREHGLPGGPGVHRGEGRLCPRGHPALGPSRHRQDPHGRSGRRRDRQAVRVRRPGRVHQHVHGRRGAQGQVRVPQAAQAGLALWRGNRLLRRGRLARQPRDDERPRCFRPRWCARHAAAGTVDDQRLPRRLVPVREQRLCRVDLVPDGGAGAKGRPSRTAGGEPGTGG